MDMYCYVCTGFAGRACGSAKFNHHETFERFFSCEAPPQIHNQGFFLCQDRREHNYGADNCEG
jgi:hypothetical protein